MATIRSLGFLADPSKLKIIQLSQHTITQATTLPLSQPLQNKSNQHAIKSVLGHAPHPQVKIGLSASLLTTHSFSIETDFSPRALKKLLKKQFRFSACYFEYIVPSKSTGLSSVLALGIRKKIIHQWLALVSACRLKLDTIIAEPLLLMDLLPDSESPQLLCVATQGSYTLYCYKNRLLLQCLSVTRATAKKNLNRLTQKHPSLNSLWLHPSMNEHQTFIQHIHASCTLTLISLYQPGILKEDLIPYHIALQGLQ